MYRGPVLNKRKSELSRSVHSSLLSDCRCNVTSCLMLPPQCLPCHSGLSIHWNHEPEYNFSPFSCICLIFFHSCEQSKTLWNNTNSQAIHDKFKFYTWNLEETLEKRESMDHLPTSPLQKKLQHAFNFPI